METGKERSPPLEQGGASPISAQDGPTNSGSDGRAENSSAPLAIGVGSGSLGRTTPSCSPTSNQQEPLGRSKGPGTPGSGTAGQKTAPQLQQRTGQHQRDEQQHHAAHERQKYAAGHEEEQASADEQVGPGPLSVSAVPSTAAHSQWPVSHGLNALTAISLICARVWGSAAAAGCVLCCLLSGAS
jgi:hypothetical protein